VSAFLKIRCGGRVGRDVAAFKAQATSTPSHLNRALLFPRRFHWIAQDAFDIQHRNQHMAHEFFEHRIRVGDGLFVRAPPSVRELVRSSLPLKGGEL
jgi:hypothetical protein